MKYSHIDGLDKPISKIVFGTATPKLFAAVSENATEKDKADAFALLDEVYVSGINTFDCAAHYGEEILGEWMEVRGIREKCVVITKCAHPNKWRHRVMDFDILSDIHDSLKKLRTDYVDIYMLHRDNEEVAVSVVADVLNRLYSESKIKLFGGSNWTHKRIAELNSYAKEHNMQGFAVSSPNFGLAEQIADPWLCDAHFGNGCVTISGRNNADARKWYAENKLPVFAYSSLARGFFSGMFKSNEPEKAKAFLDEPGRIGYFCEDNFEKLKRCEILAKEKNVTVAQIAIAWIYNQEFEVYAISSPVTKEQLAANIAAMDIELSENEVKWLNLERSDV